MPALQRVHFGRSDLVTSTGLTRALATCRPDVGLARVWSTAIRI